MLIRLMRDRNLHGETTIQVVRVLNSNCPVGLVHDDSIVALDDRREHCNSHVVVWVLSNAGGNTGRIRSDLRASHVFDAMASFHRRPLKRPAIAGSATTSI